MSKILTVPYIFFTGNCREAMNFYKSVFGGELDITTYAEAKMEGGDMPSDSIMHCHLSGGDVEFMGCDSRKASSEAKKISICINGDNEKRMREMFEALSVDTKVQYPLEKQFWGSTFGAFMDKYGVEWMFDIAGQEAAK